MREGRERGLRRVQVMATSRDGRAALPASPAAAGIGGARYEMVADQRAGLALGATVMLGNDRHLYRVVGTHAWPCLVRRRSADLRPAARQPGPAIPLSPPAAGRAQAAEARRRPTDTVNAVIARLHPGADPDAVADTVRRWKHLTALTDAEQANLLMRSVVDRARVQLGMFTVVLLFVSAVIIALIIYTMTMDKVREIATLKLIGAPDRIIVGAGDAAGAAARRCGLPGGGRRSLLAVKDFFPRRRGAGRGGDRGHRRLVIAAICLAGQPALDPRGDADRAAAGAGGLSGAEPLVRIERLSKSFGSGDGRCGRWPISTCRSRRGRWSGCAGRPAAASRRC